MEVLLWKLSALNGESLSAPLIHSLALLSILCWDYWFLLLVFLWRQARHGGRAATFSGTLPSALVVIPSLLRKRAELTSMISTVRSVAHNGYPSQLLVVVSIDGSDEQPALYQELFTWAKAERMPHGVTLHLTGTSARHGKPMAIERGFALVQRLVRTRSLRALPPVYISTDADADLGAGALEKIVRRLHVRNRWTGWPARAVAGNLFLRGDAFWPGFAKFFSVNGQLKLQIARHYLVANVARHNLRPVPMCGVPGVLYCTWTEIFLQAPKFLSFVQSLRFTDWCKWWLGAAPPSYAQSQALPKPELLAGDTDDTVSAFLAVLATFRNGKLELELPRTPLHAALAMLRGVFLDRALRYEPSAHVFTSSPETIPSLFKQRRRWNSARIEVTGRFWRVLFFHWSLGLPAVVILWMVARSWICGAALYYYLPLALFKASHLTAFVFGFTCHALIIGVVTACALILNNQAKHWRMLWAVPLAPLYGLFFAYLPALVGGVSDVFLFGNRTGFAPEHTLIRGGSSRIALAYRLRRASLMAARAVLHGDVPFGKFWLGWRETPWTSNGYEGWTTGKKPSFHWRKQPLQPKAASEHDPAAT
jgi:hypothetical protein